MPDFSKVPQELKDCHCWLVAKLVPRTDRPGKFRKVPLSVVTGSSEEWNAKESLSSFADAEKYVLNHPTYILGFAFEHSPFLGGDCDNAFDEQGFLKKAIEPVYNQYCRGFYSERSPSGKGVRFFLRKDGPVDGELPERKAFKLHGDCQVEIFRGGYCTVTGCQLVKDGPVGIKSAVPDEVYAFCGSRSLADAEADTAGGRNPSLAKYAGALAQKPGLSYQEAKDLILARNKQLAEPLSESDLEATVFKSLRKWVEERKVQEVPAGVDLEAIDDSSLYVEIGDIPDSAMYGKAKEYSKRLLTPHSLGYLSILAAASALPIPKTQGVSPNLYVSTVAEVGRGKSVARERAGKLVNPNIEYKTPNSDRGLFALFEETKGQPVLLSLDEGRVLMSKGAIDGSALPSILCSLWNSTKAGGATKQGVLGCEVRLSILMGIKISSPNEFPQVFGFATAHGLYDRMLFGLSLKPWEYEEWQDPVYGIDTELDCIPFSTPKISEAAFQAAKEWRRAVVGRDESGRLKENALRVALVSAALNEDQEVSLECMQCSLKLMEWQEQIRKVYQPAKGASEASECMEAVLDAFEKSKGKSINWRETARKAHWHRRFPRTLMMVKRQLEMDGTIELHRESGRHFYRGESA